MDFLAIKTEKEHIPSDRQLSESASDVIVCQLFCLLDLGFYVIGPARKFRLLRWHTPRGYKMKHCLGARGANHSHAC
jgi:hypothetical protein